MSIILSKSRILKLALPAAGTFILSNFYNINDLYFAGRISQAANNALGLCMMVLIFNAGFVILASRGALSLVARLTGAREDRAVGETVIQGLMLCLCITVSAGIIGWFMAPHLLSAMGGQGNVLSLATTYLRVVYIGLPILALQALADAIFLGRGNSRTPMQNQFIAVSGNLLLNALVVFVLHGGITGIAVASIISRALAAIRGFWLLREILVIPHWRQWRPRWPQQLEMLRVGVPTGASVALYSGIFMILNRLLSRFGQEAFGVVGIGIRGIESIGFMVLLGFGVAASSLSGQAVGAGNQEELRAAGWAVTRAAFPIVLFFSALWWFFPEILIGFYTKDPVVTQMTVTYLKMAALANFVQLLEMVPGDAMNGAGVPRWQVTVAISGNLLRIPLAWVLVTQTSLGINGIWLAILFSSLLKGAAMAAVYQWSAWPQKAMRRYKKLQQGLLD